MEFDEAWPLLERALSRAGSETITREQIEGGLMSGRFQLFSAGTSAAIGTTIGKTYRIGLAGGTMADMADLEWQASDYARKAGCSAVEIVGREGWQRVFPDYEKAAVVLRKEL